VTTRTQPLAPRPPSSADTDSAEPTRPVAVALRYDGASDDAPRVVAKGEGQVAEQIIAIARERGIEIREDADLVSLLAAVRLDSPIPIEAYVAVAQILSYIYRRRGQAAPQAKS
jgi:flagellar biosynthesis protein